MNKRRGVRHEPSSTPRVLAQNKEDTKSNIKYIQVLQGMNTSIDHDGGTPSFWQEVRRRGSSRSQGKRHYYSDEGRRAFGKLQKNYLHATSVFLLVMRSTSAPMLQTIACIPDSSRAAVERTVRVYYYPYPNHM
jgi:hypothetical protein